MREAIPRERMASVLRTLRHRLGVDLDWQVGGSVALALQGILLDVHDVDLMTDAHGSYEIQRRCHELVMRPVTFSTSGRVRSHFGSIDVQGVTVEVMGDLQVRPAGGAWGEPFPGPRDRRWLDVEGLELPVASLQSALRLYRALCRTERAGLVAAALERQGLTARGP